MIEIKELVVKYKGKLCDKTAIEGLNINITKGDIFTFIGPSGCGKSTLLNVLTGIITDYSGSVLINGSAVNPKTQRIGTVFQHYGLLPWKNVYDNAILGLKIKRGKCKEFEGDEYAENILKQLGIFELRSKYPKELSGGQKQRVAIARAFIIKPSVLLMDEPFSALDAITREEMQELFLNIWREHRVTTVFVTHSVEEALYLGEKVVILSGSPGRVYKLIHNEIFGINNVRFSDEFYKKSSELRKIIEMGWAK